jgi:predicted RecB family endonuclease
MSDIINEAQMSKPSFFKPLLEVSNHVDEALERLTALKTQVERTKSSQYYDLISELDATFDDLKGAQDKIGRARACEKAIRTSGD